MLRQYSFAGLKEKPGAKASALEISKAASKLELFPTTAKLLDSQCKAKASLPVNQVSIT